VTAGLNGAVLGLERSAIREFSRLARETPGCVSLTLGEPDFDTPEPVSREAAAALARGETHYIENAGAAALREEICRYERERNGLRYDPDEVIVPTPAFVLYEQQLRLCRAVCVKLDTAPDGFQITQEALSRALSPRTKAIVLNSPNNPTGCILNGASLAAVRRAAEERGLYVVCDDVYRRLVYTGDYHSFAEFAELKAQILVAQSFSKPWAMTGWRMGYLLAARPVLERLALVHQFLTVSTPAPFQSACVQALRCDPAPLVETYRRRRSYVLERLSRMGLETPEPQGAFYVFPSIGRFGLPSGEFCRRMIKEAGLAATPGACFGGEGHIRLSYCYSEDALREGLSRLERFTETF